MKLFSASDCDDDDDSPSFQEHSVHQSMVHCSVSSLAYFQAVGYCPYLVETETSPDIFLKFCQYDADQAASRLACYWNLRFELFGNQCCFLPLSQALGTKGWDFLKRGTCVLLPSSSSTDPCSVMYVDLMLSKFVGPELLETRKWCLFYLLSIMQQQSCEFTLLVRVGPFLTEQNDSVSDDELELFALLQAMLKVAFCIKPPNYVHIIYMTTCSSLSEKNPISPWLQTLLKLGVTTSITSHTGRPREIMQTLREHGFESFQVPESMGGDWDSAREWAYWIERQRDKQDRRTSSVDQAGCWKLSTEAGTIGFLSADSSSVATGGSLAIPFENHPVHEAMELAASNSAAYYRAVMLCPEVIELDSPHDQFHRFTGYNPWEAAQRLANYWSVRVECFGDTAAFLPIQMALQPEDHELFLSGKNQLAPLDASRRSVVFIDRDLVKTEPKPEEVPCRMRCNFFHYQQVMQQSSEFVFVLRVNNSRLSTFRSDKKLTELFRTLTCTAMCLEKCAHLHLVSVNPPRNTTHYAMRLLMLKLFHRLNSWFRNMPTSLHLGSLDQVAASLEKYGMRRENIPVRLGGTWNSDPDWRRRFGWLEAKQPVELAQFDAMSPAPLLDVRAQDLGTVSDLAGGSTGAPGQGYAESEEPLFEPTMLPPVTMDAFSGSGAPELSDTEVGDLRSGYASANAIEADALLFNADDPLLVNAMVLPETEDPCSPQGSARVSTDGRRARRQDEGRQRQWYATDAYESEIVLPNTGSLNDSDPFSPTAEGSPDLLQANLELQNVSNVNTQEAVMPCGGAVHDECTGKRPPCDHDRKLKGLDSKFKDIDKNVESIMEARRIARRKKRNDYYRKRVAIAQSKERHDASFYGKRKKKIGG